MSPNDENDEYELGPEPELPEREFPQPAFPPATLDYQGRVDSSSQGQPPMAVQVTLGFFAWVLAVVFIVLAVNLGNGTLQQMSANLALTAACVALAALFAATFILRVRHGWRGFLPGVLLGFGLTCLLPIGIVLAICGGVFR